MDGFNAGKTMARAEELGIDLENGGDEFGAMGLNGEQRRLLEESHR